jgi:hypothetical protein
MSASDAEQVAGGQPPQHRAVIFESYGRSDATDAAEKIKLSLRENGYEVLD